MIRQRKNQGFVLLLVLAVLVIASVVLSGWAYRNSSGVLHAGQIAQDTQRKWGNLSCQKLMFSIAEDIVDEESEDSDEPAITVVREVQLNDMKYQLTLSDEQAKANVNFLLKNEDKQYVIAQIDRLLPDKDSKPTIREKIADGQTNCSSFDQIFDYEDPAQLVGIESLTCWGSGLVNYKRSPEQILKEVTQGILSNTDIQKLLELRREDSEGGLEELFKKLNLRKKQIAPLKKILTNVSNCKSLWVKCQSDTRNWYRLYVEIKDPDKESSRILVYQW